MQLLHPASFVSAVASSFDCLENISDIIGKYCGKESKEKFIDACKNNDSRTANAILDKSVIAMTGGYSVSSALDDFADKFPGLNLSREVESCIFEMDKVKAIGRYSGQIKSVINNKRK